MKDKQKVILTTVRECLNEQSLGVETLEQFYNRFEKENKNPNFLRDNFRNPNFRLELTHDGNVKSRIYSNSMPNKCETNTFNFIKDMSNLNNHRYYPVSGWFFIESTTYVEHFWVYDAVNDLFLDITPMSDGLPYAYGGVINFDINEDIANAEKYDEINFLRGKRSDSLYRNHIDNVVPDKIKKDKVNQTIFDFIHKNEKYKDLSEFIFINNIADEDELKSYLYKLENKRDGVRNNREWDYYSNLISQIKYLNK